MVETLSIVEKEAPVIVQEKVEKQSRAEEQEESPSATHKIEVAKIEE